MAYTKTTWVNNVPPALNATNLNNIEDGIEALDTAMTTAESDIDDLEAAMSTAESDIDDLETAVGTINTTIGATGTKYKYLHLTPNDMNLSLLMGTATELAEYGATTNGNLFVSMPYGTPTEGDIVGFSTTFNIPNDYKASTPLSLIFKFESSDSSVTGTETLALTCAANVHKYNDGVSTVDDVLVANVFTGLSTLTEFAITDTHTALTVEVTADADIVARYSAITLVFERELLEGTHEGDIRLFGIDVKYVTDPTL